MARPIRKTSAKEVPLAEVMGDFSRYRKEAASRSGLRAGRGVRLEDTDI
jgi:hypothetical protein